MARADNYFTLLGQPVAFTLEMAELDSNYRKLARQVHPDRFAAASEQDRLQAVQQAAVLNQAYETLKSPTKRALYLLNLQAPMAEEATVQDPGFLMQQMEWREELEELADAGDVSSLAVFRQQLRVARSDLDKGFDAVWSVAGQREQAERLARRMQFLDKMLYEIRQLEERLDD